MVILRGVDFRKTLGGYLIITNHGMTNSFLLKHQEFFVSFIVFVGLVSLCVCFYLVARVNMW